MVGTASQGRTPRVIECPNCHTQNPESNRFCQSCGTSLRPAAQPDQPAEQPADRASGGYAATQLINPREVQRRLQEESQAAASPPPPTPPAGGEPTMMAPGSMPPPGPSYPSSGPSYPPPASASY